MEKFQADGPSGFVAGSFGVDTILVVPEAAAKLAAPEGLVLKWASQIRVIASGGVGRLVKVLIVGQPLALGRLVREIIVHVV